MATTPAEPAARLRAPRFPPSHVAITLLCVALIAVGWTATVLHVREERRQDVEEVKSRNAHLALTLEEQTIRTLKGTNQALSFIKHEIEHGAARPALKDLVDRGVLDDSLFDRIEITDEFGNVGTENGPPPVTSVADHAFFKALRRQPSQALYISEPTRDATGRWTIRLARRVDKPNGGFAGVVFAAVNTAYFTRLYQHEDLGELGLITLVGLEDGIVRATRVGDRTISGQDLRTSRLLAEQARSPIGSFVATDHPEAIERFYSYRTLREYPLVVAVGTSVSESLAPFTDHARDYYVFATSVSLLIILLAAGSAFGISQKRRVFDTLARSEQRYRDIFTHTRDGIVVLDLGPDGAFRFADANHAFTELSGLPSGATTGKRVDEVFPPGPQSLADEIERCVSRRVAVSASRDVELPAGHRNLWITLVPISHEDESVRRVMGVIRDFTETHRAATALRTADASNQAKNALLAKMGHELRSPLAGVLGMFELLAHTPLDRDQAMMLDALQQSARSLLRSVEDVLDFSRMDSGEIHLAPEATSIQKLVGGVAGVYAASAAARGLIFTQYVDPLISPALMADPLRLRQVLSNFVENAIKFTQRGRVDLRAEAVARDSGSETIRFSVTDTGIGIPEEKQAELFHPAAQGADSGRSGLGLSICQRLAALMKATIGVQSVPGRGTTVSLVVRLPLADPEALPQLATVHALRGPQAEGGGQPVHAIAPASPLDDGVLAEVAAGDGALARDILKRFHRYNAEDTELLDAAVLRADVDQVTYASHRIKEASRTIGAMALATLCEGIEREARAGDWDAVARHMIGYRAELARLGALVSSFEA